MAISGILKNARSKGAVHTQPKNEQWFMIIDNTKALS